GNHRVLLLERCPEPAQKIECASLLMQTCGDKSVAATGRQCFLIRPGLNYRFQQSRQRNSKNTPQTPHSPPNTSTATIMATGCRLTTSENSNGTSTLPSSA